MMAKNPRGGMKTPLTRAIRLCRGQIEMATRGRVYAPVSPRKLLCQAYRAHGDCEDECPVMRHFGIARCMDDMGKNTVQYAFRYFGLSHEVTLGQLRDELKYLESMQS